MIEITKGLIIADPWIEYILNNEKTWEMRTTGCSHRGWFGLIRKGSKKVWGIANLIDVGPKLLISEMIESIEQHRIPENMIRNGSLLKWNIPWKLNNIIRLKTPISYEHKRGAVIWVKFSSVESDKIIQQLAAHFSS